MSRQPSDADDLALRDEDAESITGGRKKTRSSVTAKTSAPAYPAASGTQYIDTASFQPLLVVESALGLTIRVLDYRALPGTPANLKLTSLARTHPGARVDTAPHWIMNVYADAAQIRPHLGEWLPDLGPVG
jgi:hypothetical protein